MYPNGGAASFKFMVTIMGVRAISHTMMDRKERSFSQEGKIAPSKICRQ